MNCPKCKSPNGEVTRTLNGKNKTETPKYIRDLKLNVIFRRRICRSCDNRWATVEIISNDATRLVQNLIAAMQIPMSRGHDAK
jgi:transcriptional regulator NrdR family protein